MNLLDAIKIHLKQKGYRFSRLAPGYSVHVVQRGALFVAYINPVSRTEIHVEMEKPTGPEKISINFHDPTSFKELDRLLGEAIEQTKTNRVLLPP